MTFSVLILGLGQIGMGYDLKLDPATFALTHARGFARHDAFHLAGGVDPSAERRDLFEVQYKVPAFADVKSAMEKLQPDVIVVATPTETHCATVRTVMQAGRPRVILCEKPLAYELGEAQEIAALCAKGVCGLFVNYMRRSDCGTAEIKRRLDGGSIANPEKVVVWYSKGIFNNGSHFLNLLQYWLGDVTALQVIEPGRLWDGCDPEPDVALTFARGTKAYFLAAREENFSHYTMEIFAANGRLQYGRGGEEVLWQKANRDPTIEGYTVLDSAAEIIATDLAQAQWHVADQLAETLNGRPAQICTGSEALRTLETLVAIRAKTMSDISTGERLALHGGQKTITAPISRYNSIGKEEMEAATRVIQSGVLSQFLGCWDPDFYGGPNVQAFERASEKAFGVKHAVTVNSLTSGLIAAVGAIGIEPGDEVIVSPWTMCATATAILHWNAIPVFADIEPETFCLDLKSVAANITPYTKAILAVDIFGHSADMTGLMDLAHKHGLKVISDTAQAIGARYHNKYAGTLADIGGYSLNYHKHIHTGEGGIMVTDDDAMAERMRLIRNHAEAVVEDKGTTNLANMVGYNFRLGEIECAIGAEQLKKLEDLVERRRRMAERLTRGISHLPGLQTPVVKPGCTHSYYIYPMVLDVERLGVSRSAICQALEAEGITALGRGYQNVHLLPMYQKKIAYGSHGFPWSADFCKREVDYRKGICPVAEALHDSTFMGIEMCVFELTDADIDLIAAAFCKVWGSLETLK